MRSTSADGLAAGKPAGTPAVAIVSKQRILGATNGSSAYVIACARSLSAAGFAVHLIQPSPAIAGRTPFMRMRPEMKVFERHAIRGAIRVGQFYVFLHPSVWLGALLGVVRHTLRMMGARGKWAQDRPRPYAVATPWLERDLAFVKANIPASSAALVADYMFCAPAFAAASPGMPTAIIMHDLFHSREGDGKDSVARISRAEEIAMLAGADAVFAIQEAEKRFVSEHVPGTEAVLVPMPARPVDRPAPGEDDRVLFVGSNTAPNSVGLAWFLEEVWPEVLNRRPDCTLDVAGSVDRAFDFRGQPNVRFLGMVDDLAPLYRQAGIVISPLTFGSGLKIKLVEALAHGKAIVATAITLQGVADICGDAVICADEAGSFADAIIGLAGDRERREELAGRALACAKENFTAESVHSGLREWISRSL